MQKVEGSNPFSRSHPLSRRPAFAGLFCARSRLVPHGDPAGVSSRIERLRLAPRHVVVGSLALLHGEGRRACGAPLNATTPRAARKWLEAPPSLAASARPADA